jgi:hypothetical protein
MHFLKNRIAKAFSIYPKNQIFGIAFEKIKNILYLIQIIKKGNTLKNLKISIC